MADSIFASILSHVTDKSNFTAINEITKRPCWKTLRIKDVEIDLSAAVTANPIFVGKSSDSATLQSLLSNDLKTIKIINPTRMRITGRCESKSLIGELISSFEDAQSTFRIVSKDVSSDNMVMTTMDIEQSADMTSAVTVIIELERAVAPPTKGEYNPAQEADSPSKNSTLQNPPTALTTISGLANKVTKFIKG